MGYSKRIRMLCSYLRKAESFADVGCDHGYCSEYVLKSGLCQKVILSDISRGSLAKAEALLEEFAMAGKAVFTLGDGFQGVPNDTKEVLIAGMGGSEIISILSDKKYGFIPEYFVLQPMHDSDKLRAYLLQNDAEIYVDETFTDGKKFYDVICGGNGKASGQVRSEREILSGQAYTQAEIEFGKGNLKYMPQAFLKRTEKLLKDTQRYLLRENLQEESRRALLAREVRLQGVLSGEIK